MKKGRQLPDKIEFNLNLDLILLITLKSAVPIICHQLMVDTLEFPYID